MSIVGVALNNGSHIWYEREVEAERRVLAEAGHELISVDAEDSPQRQMAQIAGLLDQGAEVLVVSATRATAIDEALDKAQSRAVPVITESVAVDHPAVAVQVKADDLAIGRMLGRAVGKSTSGIERPILLSFGFPELDEANRREWGFMGGLRETHPDVVAVYLDSKAQIPIAREAGRRWRGDSALGEPDIVMGVDDEALIGGLEGLNDAGVSTDEMVTAAFGISPPSGPTRLDDGTIDFGAAMFPELHGTLIAELAIALLDGREVDEAVAPPGAVVTAEGTPQSWSSYYQRSDDGTFELDVAAAHSS